MNLRYREYNETNQRGITSFNPTDLSLSAVITTDKPTRVFDWKKWEYVNEILDLNGLELYQESIVLLDNHNRNSSSDVIGKTILIRRSAEPIQDNYYGLLAQIKFDKEDEKAVKIAKKYENDYMRSFSIGYEVLESKTIKANEQFVYNGNTYAGPLEVATKWKLYEVSTTPIPADNLATARKQDNNTINNYEVFKMTNTQEQEIQVKAADNGELDKVPVEIITAEEEKKIKVKEKKRITELRLLAKSFATEIDNHEDIAELLIENDYTIEKARSVILDKILERKNRTQSADIPFMAAKHIENGIDVFKEDATNSLLLRSMPYKKTTKENIDSGNALRSYTLLDLARKTLELKGLSTAGGGMEIVKRAMSTSDFAVILDNTVKKVIANAAENFQTTYQVWCGIDTHTNFKEFDVAGLGGFDSLEELEELEDTPYGSRKSKKEKTKIKVFGKKFAFSMESILNNETSLILNDPIAMAQAAMRTIDKLPYDVLKNNPVMNETGNTLFHATHKNIGTAGAISETTAQEAFAGMALQLDVSGVDTTGIEPQFILAPKVLTAKMRKYFGSMFIGTQAEPNIINPFANMPIQLVFSHWLDDLTTPATHYFFAGPQGMTVTMYFLDGNQTPMVEMETNLNNRAYTWYVNHYAIAKAVDYRFLYKNDGGA